MSKKGFTLVEVIVSIVLVSVIMVSLLATLVKLRDTYTVIHENSDVIVYTSSIARVINNDLMKNNGIRYANCEIEGKKCELILGNAEKRKLEIIEEGEGIDLGDGKENIKHERILTTLKYTNTTKEEKLIYIRTLILDRYENSESGVITTKGYNFYDMNVPESNTYYGKEAESNVVDTISRVNIRIWDGKSEESTKYDIVLYSSGRYDDSELVGKSYRIAFDTNGATESGTLEIDEVFGVAYFNSEKSHSSSNIIRKIIKPVKMENGKPMAFLGYYYYTGPSDSIGSQVVDSKGMIVSSSRLFKNDVTLSGLEELSEEERKNRERVIAEWGECTNGYTVKEGECVPEEYTVEIDKNGGSGGIDSYKATYLAMVPNLSKLQLPTRDGYKFKGLYEGEKKYQDENGIGQLMYEYTYGITVKADWEARTYEIKYSLNDGLNIASNPTQATYDVDINIENPTKEYTVNINGNNQGATISQTSVSGNQVFAGWSSNESNGLGIHAKNGESESETSWNGAKTTKTHFKNLRDTEGTITLIANWSSTNITLSTITKTGYTCGYVDNASETNIKYTSGGIYATSDNGKSVTIYARCKPNTYTVTFNANGGSGGQTDAVTATYDVSMPSITSTKPTRENYTFMGWYDNATYTSGTQYYTDTGGSARTWDKTSSTTLYAGWKQKSVFTFSYTGKFKVIDGSEENTYAANSAGTTVYIKNTNWKVHFLSSGVFKKELLNTNIDIFAVGGGGGSSGSNASYCNGGTNGGCNHFGAGGGGFTTTKTNVSLTQSSYTVTIGAGGGLGSDGNTSSFGSLCSAAGGKHGNFSYCGECSNGYFIHQSHFAGGTGGSGGSGGAGIGGHNTQKVPSGGTNGGAGGTGRMGYYIGPGSTYYTDHSGGSGCATNNGCKINNSVCKNTQEFCESSGTIYAGGGGGGSGSGGPGEPSYCGKGGAGGGGGYKGNNNYGIMFNGTNECTSNPQNNNGTPNTGGGGASWGGKGGSGIVIIRNKR